MPNVADNNLNVNTDDYDLYNSQGEPESLPGSPEYYIPDNTFVIPMLRFFPPSTLPQSTMDLDPNNTGPTTDFWSFHPITIDVNGYIFYYDENTGINIRGPAGAPNYIRFDELTPEQKAELKGQDGTNGVNGQNGTNGRDGVDGLDAYHVWLRDNGYIESQHPITEFYDYLAGYNDQFVKEGTGQGSLIVNYRGEQNIASGIGSFASGYQTTARHSYSFSAGQGTQTGANHQFVLGKFNKGLSTNIFEIGNGSSTSLRSNAFEITSGGSVKAAGSITDGNGNVLSNKVDKVSGKSLSTYDFNSQYKSFIDNYHIETEINSVSNNPVTSAAIYNALENLRNTISSKPGAEVGTTDTDYSMLAYRRVNDNNLLEMSVKMTGFTWNPNKKVLHIGDSNTTTSNIEHNYVLGLGLESISNNQIILGKFNSSNSNDMIQVGNGASNVSRSNILRLTKTGSLIVAGDITDGNGNILSGKQDTLQYDSIATQNSTKVMTSGAIYNTLTGVGITPGVGINIPAISVLQAQMTTVNTSLTSLDTRVTNLENQLMIDEVTGDRYSMGIRNGKLYILKQQQQQNNNEEEEEEETNANDSE